MPIILRFTLVPSRQLGSPTSPEKIPTFQIALLSLFFITRPSFPIYGLDIPHVHNIIFVRQASWTARLSSGWAVQQARRVCGTR